MQLCGDFQGTAAKNLLLRALLEERSGQLRAAKLLSLEVSASKAVLKLFEESNFSNSQPLEILDPTAI